MFGTKMVAYQVPYFQFVFGIRLALPILYCSNCCKPSLSCCLYIPPLRRSESIIGSTCSRLSAAMLTVDICSRLYPATSAPAVIDQGDLPRALEWPSQKQLFRLLRHRCRCDAALADSLETIVVLCRRGATAKASRSPKFCSLRARASVGLLLRIRNTYET